MKIKDLSPYVFDKIVVYELCNDCFNDLYKGEVNNIHSDILDKDIRIIGAARKGFMDVGVS